MFFNEIRIIRKCIDNSLAGFLVGLVILYGYFSDSLLPGLDIMALFIGGLLSIFFSWVMIWKEKSDIGQFVELFRFSALSLLLAIMIIWTKTEALFKMMDTIIFMPYEAAVYFAGLFIFLAVGTAMLMIVMGLKTMFLVQE
jgi:hypothetical protein